MGSFFVEWPRLSIARTAKVMVAAGWKYLAAVMLSEGGRWSCAGGACAWVVCWLARGWLWAKEVTASSMNVAALWGVARASVGPGR